MNNLPAISNVSLTTALPPAPGLGEANAPSDQVGFKQLLMDSIQNVNQMQVDADQAVEALFTGGDVNPAEVLTAVQKADLAFRLTMQMRNKVMDVFQEIRDIRI
ncbi:MAG: flagellar hook-basal body complex protein FliE [Planctomycetota bacterium]